MKNDNTKLERAIAVFSETLPSLVGPIEDLHGSEASRAKALYSLLSKLWRDADQLEQMKSSRWGSAEDYVDAMKTTRTWLTELEQLLLGQRMLFGGSPRRVSARGNPAAIRKIFRRLFAITRAVPRLAADGTEHLAGHTHRSVDYRKRETGLKHGSKAAKPAKRKAATKTPKLPTFPEARDRLLVALGRAGWALSPALKVPHATSPNGRFRLWFKAQAVYSSQGSDVKDFGQARTLSYDLDIRKADPTKFVSWVTKMSEASGSPYGRRLGSKFGRGPLVPLSQEFAGTARSFRQEGRTGTAKVFGGLASVAHAVERGKRALGFSPASHYYAFLTFEDGSVKTVSLKGKTFPAAKKSALYTVMRESVAGMKTKSATGYGSRGKVVACKIDTEKSAKARGLSPQKAKADRLYSQAQENHRRAYERAKSIPDHERRQSAFREADRVWDMQREYQRKARHGESPSHYERSELDKMTRLLSKRWTTATAAAKAREYLRRGVGSEELAWRMGAGEKMSPRGKRQKRR